MAYIAEVGGAARPTGRPPLPALTSLRFFAALSVLVSHADHFHLVKIPREVIRWLDAGRPAVSLFFVLSGFILTYNYHGRLDTPERIRRFAVARFARIYPVCLLSLLIAVVPVAHMVQTHATNRIWTYRFRHQTVPMGIALGLIIQLLCLVAWSPIPVTASTWNAPSWSLSCEVFFYACFPNFLRRSDRVSSRGLAIWMVVFWLLQGLWIWAINAYIPDGRTTFIAYQHPVTHLFDFVLGVSTGLWFLRSRGSGGSQPGRWAVPVAVMAVLAIGLISFFSRIQPAYYLLNPFFALLIIALAELSLFTRLLAAAPLVLLGEASYSLYMTHVPLFRIFESWKLEGTSGTIAVLGAVGLSILIFRYFEEPSRRYLRRRLG